MDSVAGERELHYAVTGEALLATFSPRPTHLLADAAGPELGLVHLMLEMRDGVVQLVAQAFLLTLRAVERVCA